MRLGTYDCVLLPNTLAHEAYLAKQWGKDHKGKYLVHERHRHRYEVNNEYVDHLVSKGLIFSGSSPDGLLMEIAELPKKVHPFFLGTQFHPEFLARPLDPHPLFSAFIKASIKNSSKK